MPLFVRLRENDLEFQTSLEHIVRLSKRGKRIKVDMYEVLKHLIT